MPVCLDFDHSRDDGQAVPKWLRGREPVEFQEQSSQCITIGLINNMPDEALKTTERQFLSLLDAASDGIQIRLSLYSLPEIPRRESNRRYIKNFYSSIENLWNGHVDGLIVTGREPLTPNLKDEPYWESFTRLLEWAQNNTHSTVWSCLAAHAAVLHMNGIERIKSIEKHSGIFECKQVSDHPLMAGTPPLFRLPHSRWNGISEKELTSFGYSVLTRTADLSIDTFVKQQKSLFVFFQGHPEYEPNTILREYRRDVGRYLKGETDTYPSMPQNYFDLPTLSALTALREEATCRRREGMLQEVSAVLGRKSIQNTWHSTAACIYRNWLEYICAQKKLRLENSKITAKNIPAREQTRSRQSR